MKRQLRELEEVVVDAWPAAETEELEGWLLRASGGPTRRGNSTATLDVSSDMPIEERIAQVEAWYRKRGQPAVFQVGPCALPKELDQTLAARGYALKGTSAFAVADPEAVMASAASHWSTRVSAKAERAWFDAVGSASRFAADLDGLRGFLKRLGSRCRFAQAVDADGKVLACALGIASEDRLGIYSMLTLPSARRQGAARALLYAFADSARQDAMRELYLLVELDNVPARALYAASGFRDVYQYHYRVQPEVN